MDQGYTYSTRDRVHLMVYVAPGYEPPDTLMLTRDGAPVEFLRLSDRSLICGKIATRIDAQGKEVPVPSECTNFDCHRAVLGECQCGRHPSPVRFEKASS